MCVKVPGSLMEHALDCQVNSKYFSNISLVVYRLVHAPVTRESGVRLPARESFAFSYSDPTCLVWVSLLQNSKRLWTGCDLTSVYSKLSHSAAPLSTLRTTGGPELQIREGDRKDTPVDITQ